MKVNSTIYPLLLTGLLLPLIFSCKKEVIPTVTVAAVTNIKANSATSGGEIITDGGASVISRGVCWSTNQNPTTEDSKTTDGTGKGSFSSSITELTPGATYNLKAYAINAVGTAYSNLISFSTLALAPVLITTYASAVTSSSVNSGGNITNDGGSPVTARGVCWGTILNPTIADSKTSDGAGSGIFTSTVTGLTPGTKYYIRAYASNSIGTAYGNQFTTTTMSILPTITTTEVSVITATTATSGGNITNNGGAAVTARGVCWSTLQTPTTSNNKTTEGTGGGVFTSILTNLTFNTIYYVRAYATNSIGTAYGTQVSFITSAVAPVVPTLTTYAASSITSITATSGGNISSDGGDAVTARGICWSTSSNPTISDSKTINGTGAGSFISSITGLTANTTYYIRAYATNSEGTAYGNNASFITSSIQIQLPTITTTDASSITTISATSGGNISSDSGAEVTARGVCWSTSQNPTTSDSKTANGAGTGSFTSSITGLTSGRIYYVRAYATNIAGTAYGSQISFITQQTSPGTVSDVDGNIYSTVTIGNQEWMAKNLKTTKYNDGTSIPLEIGSAEWGALITPAYCWYENSVTTYGTYGVLYNWYAVNTGKLCPIGWHVPSDAEWTTLTTYLGGESVAGGKLKATTQWNSPNTGATNETGFTALPGGLRYYGGGAFSSIGFDGNWWSSTGTSTPFAWPRGISYNFSNVYNPNYSKRSGFSVRCLRD